MGVQQETNLNLDWIGQQSEAMTPIL
jgi:hypothetical protein